MEPRFVSRSACGAKKVKGHCGRWLNLKAIGLGLLMIRTISMRTQVLE